MPQAKFTDLFVKSLKPTDALQDFVDIQTKGLHLRVTPGGVKSWQYVYRSKITGKVQNDHIGRYPDVSYAVAREHVLGGHKANATSKPVEAFTAVKKNEATVDEVFAKYRARHLATKRSRHDIEIGLAAVITRHKWGALPISALSKAMIKEALYHIKEVRKAPLGAGLTQQRISTMLRWAVDEDYIPFNPIAGMTSVSADERKPRERVLDDSEIRRLWTICENPREHGLRASYARAYQLLFLTAARRDMITSLHRDELDLDNRELGALMDIPAARMKQARAFVQPLSDLAVSIIRRKLDDCRYICPTTSRRYDQRSRQPLDGRCLSMATFKNWKRLGFKEQWTPHDLRRTAAKLLRRAGYTRDQVGSFLAHEAEGDRTMRHYDPEDRWDGFALKREMADKLAAILQGIIGAPAVHLRRVA